MPHTFCVDPDQIKAFRKGKGLSQEALGQMCGVRKSTVSEWESGKSNPSGSAAILLSEYMDGQRNLIPLTTAEERLLDEAVQRGNFSNREEFLTACLIQLIRNGEIVSGKGLPR